MEVHVQLATEAAGAEVALLATETARELGVGANCYVDLRQENFRQVLRVKIASSLAAKTVQIPRSIALPLPPKVTAKALSPCEMPMIQCLQLVAMHTTSIRTLPPVGLLHRMLTGRVLLQKHGVVSCQQQGIDYGRWKYTAFHDHTLVKGACCCSSTEDALTGVIQPQTLVVVSPFPCILHPPPNHSGSFVPLGRHAMHIKQLVAMTLRPFLRTSAMQTFGKEVSSFRSMILHAPSGAGKTILIEQLAQAFSATRVVLDASVLTSRANQMENLFSAALRTQPAMLVIENLDLLFPCQLDETRHNWMGRLSSCLEQLDKFACHTRVAVVATATRLVAIHPRVRRLFDEEVALEMPPREWSAQLLDHLLPRSHFRLTDELKKSIVIRYGQRPSHLVFLCRDLCHRMGVSRSNSLKAQPSKPMIDEQVVEKELVQLALKLPKANDTVDLLNASIPTVTWESIGGLDHVKQSLKEMVVWPLEKPQLFLRMGITPPSGMLLHGPPGTGKTMLAKAAARASRCNFLSISASDLIQAEFGESEKAITKIFDAARMMSPCMVFIDEFQSLFGNRKTAGMTSGGMISQLLMEMDSLRAVEMDHEAHDDQTQAISQRIFVLAATNCLNAIDQAFLQPGRFENILYVGLPDATERRQILELQRSRMPWDDDVNLNLLVSHTDGASPATLVALCQSAAIDAMKDPTQTTIQMRNFTEVLTHGNLELSEK